MAALSTIGLTAEAAGALLDAREVSCEELAAAYLARIEQDDRDLHAFLHVHPERTLAAARALDQRGRSGVEGVPIGLKDLLLTRDVPTTAGSRILEGFVPIASADVVERTEAAGLVSLGKLNLDEFAMGSSTEHSAYGPTANPWDLARVPGGSSGGSSAAVAAGLAPWSLGTDTGGSIRQPAAFCGIVGLKPTYGTVSRYGVVAFACSLEQVGPFALTVRDCARLFGIIAGDDPRDTTNVGPREAVALPARGGDLRGLRLGVPRDQLEEGVEPGVLARFEEAVAHARALGAEIEDCALPHARHGLAAYYLIAPAEASANLSRYDGVRYGLRVDGDDVHAMYEATRRAGFGDEVKRRIMIGAYALSAGYYDAYYGQAQRMRTLIRRDFDDAFGRLDGLLLPTAPSVAFRFGEREDPLAMYANDVFTLPANLAGIPGLSIPMGLADGLPTGLQILGPAFSENRLFQIGQALEDAIGFEPVPTRLREGAR